MELFQLHQNSVTNYTVDVLLYVSLCYKPKPQLAFHSGTFSYCAWAEVSDSHPVSATTVCRDLVVVTILIIQCVL
jgi:hypothetical protein